MSKKLSGTKQILDVQGTEGLLKWIKDQNKLLLTELDDTNICCCVDDFILKN